MRMIAYELKKLWNWRILALIAAMGLLTWFAIFKEFIEGYESLTTFGIYGAYQTEMFELYGETLEPEELEDYDIPGKKAAILSELDDIITKEPIFAENEIYNYEQFVQFEENSFTQNLSKEEEKKLSETLSEMKNKLDFGDRAQTLNEWFSSPLMRLHSIESLELTYIHYKDYVYKYYHNEDTSPIVANTLEKLVNMRNANLIQYHLSEEFSAYAMVVGIFAVIAIIIFIAPLLTNDRMWKIILLHYSSRTGRDILNYQFAAILLSASVLTIMIIVITFIPFLASGAYDYWNARMMGIVDFGVQLYNITFGQYVLLLAGMIFAVSVGTACFTFILARFSENIIIMLIKSVPVGIALASLLGISTYMALSDRNIVFNAIFRGKIHVPEVILSGFIAFIGVVMAVLILKREKRVDVV